MKRIRNVLLSGMMLLNFGLMAAVPVAVHADAAGDACTAVGSDQSCATPSGGVSINKVIKVIINILSAVVGVVAVIMLIVGGFKYITSGGDSNKVSGAKNTIIYAIIGIAIVALAQFIVQFVLNKVTS